MTKFNPENKPTLTYGECLGPAMNITDSEEAKQYLADYIAFTAANFEDASGEYTPEEVCKINLGYYSGYYDMETQKRVEKLFITSHPIFGPTHMRNY
jgi:hypothetical protein